ncbi:acyl dehydratase [Branchiibius hedensis]|uniref:Acyl dehydratase n=1 Tax=Branchiibius hedensis TaxID=672460 RepID=A0A2Y8ZUX3_9MICO|nr:MaoC family dehydratase N-terminal domain-containing protein [Branchiibius hedensis]PWJ27033.1 acyl dehydratase [Branchiibius hedensis]SSA35844.1 Acyl dehydratase [Branchiibius hedensis]
MIDDFARRLAGLVGLTDPPRVAKDPITEQAIRIWCEAVGDENPAYQDPAWAAASRWGGIIAPATSLNMWTLPGNRRTHRQGESLDRVNAVLAERGYTSVAAVQTSHRYARPLRPGELLAQYPSITAVSSQKSTRLGRGHFVDLLSEYRTLAGESVGSVLLRMLRWDPRTRPPEPAGRATGGPPGHPWPVPPPVRRPRATATLLPAQLRPGGHLPPATIPVTQASIAALATATHDFNDVHLDRDAAQARGARDVYMNILGTAGLINCYLTDWAGPEAEIVAFDARLAVQNHPGDTLQLTGAVTSVNGPIVTVDVRGSNSLGDHVLATARVNLVVQ